MINEEHIKSEVEKMLVNVDGIWINDFSEYKIIDLIHKNTNFFPKNSHWGYDITVYNRYIKYHINLKDIFKFNNGIFQTNYIGFERFASFFLKKIPARKNIIGQIVEIYDISLLTLYNCLYTINYGGVQRFSREGIYDMIIYYKEKIKSLLDTGLLFETEKDALNYISLLKDLKNKNDSIIDLVTNGNEYYE